VGWREGFAVAFLAVTAIPIARGDRPDASGMYELLPILVFTGVIAGWGGTVDAMFVAPLWASWIPRFPPGTPSRDGFRTVAHAAAVVLCVTALTNAGVGAVMLLQPTSEGYFLVAMSAGLLAIAAAAGAVAWATRKKPA
jgi:hypothetical protein